MEHFPWNYQPHPPLRTSRKIDKTVKNIQVITEKMLNITKMFYNYISLLSNNRGFLNLSGHSHHLKLEDPRRIYTKQTQTKKLNKGNKPEDTSPVSFRTIWGATDSNLEELKMMIEDSQTSLARMSGRISRYQANPKKALAKEGATSRGDGILPRPRGVAIDDSPYDSVPSKGDGLSFVEKWSGDLRMKNWTLQWRRQAKSNHHWRGLP
ncbi:hypothetical protein H5410_009669 [Solanum commersonii]|uniref:Uncharacterized protein n=1 Tax=Solanum commersonii TaxID=4109 RepID=A0A9J6AJE8_SOLCO|nr:hypothetical protein H5410_009669 [Solanum commersonii]